MELFGRDGSGDYGAISINLLPCNVRLTYLGLDDDRIDPGCEADLDK